MISEISLSRIPTHLPVNTKVLLTYSIDEIYCINFIATDALGLASIIGLKGEKVKIQNRPSIFFSFSETAETEKISTFRGLTPNTFIFSLHLNLEFLSIISLEALFDKVAIPAGVGEGLGPGSKAQYP